MLFEITSRQTIRLEFVLKLERVGLEALVGSFLFFVCSTRLKTGKPRCLKII